MTVIDKILNEWSFRCHDGIVDMNDPTKLSILNEILAEYNLNEQEEQNNNNKISLLEKILLEKNIPEQLVDYIILKVEKKDQVNDLYSLMNSVSLDSLRGKDKNLQIGNLAWLNNVIGITSKSLAIGKGEILLVIMIKEAKLDLSNIKNKDTKADLNVSGRKVEVKQSSETGGAIISKAGRSTEYTKLKEFQEKWKIKGKLTTWTSIYDKISLLDTADKLECIKDLNDSLGFSEEEGLKASDFGNNETASQNKENFNKFCKKIAYLFIGDYLDNKDLILMNDSLEYTVLNNKEQILNNPNIRFNGQFIPRAFYKEIPVNESNKLAEVEELEEK